MMNSFICLKAVPHANISILHGKFSKLGKYYISCKNLKTIPAPFERASNLGLEMTFCESKFCSYLNLMKKHEFDICICQYPYWLVHRYWYLLDFHTYCNWHAVTYTYLDIELHLLRLDIYTYWRWLELKSYL